MHAPRALAGFAVAVLSLALGCSSQTTAPDPTEDDDPTRTAFRGQTTAPTARSGGELLASEKGWGSYLPLEKGRTWQYEGVFFGWFTPYGGVTEPFVEPPYRYDLYWEIEGARTLVDGEYAQIRETLIDETGESQFCLYYRQTRDALFERLEPCGDVDRRGYAVEPAGPSRRGLQGLRTPAGMSRDRLAALVSSARSRLDRLSIAGRAFGTVSPAGTAQEQPTLTRLAYPLHPNSEWLVVRYDPDLEFHSRVVGRERRVGPSGSEQAWKIQMFSSFLGPEDEVFLYISRSGYLGYEAHLFETATDEQGTPIGDLELFESLHMGQWAVGGFVWDP